MAEFEGFPEGKIHQIPIPSSFFFELLPKIEDIGELKVALFVFWHLDRMEGSFRYLRWADFVENPLLLLSWGENPNDAEACLRQSLKLAVKRGFLLPVEVTNTNSTETIYLLNSPRGRLAIKAIENGKWKPEISRTGVQFNPEEPSNIFRLYEENIGMITPMIAEALNEAERTYPSSWIEEAIRIAVENNKRSWRYAQTILERWQREGKHGRQEKPEDRSNAEEDRRRYVEGEFSDYIEH